MRLLMFGGVAAMTLAGCGKGECDPDQVGSECYCDANADDTVNCGATGTGTGGGGGDPCDTADGVPADSCPTIQQCLDINTLTMDSVFGWDQAAGQTATVFNSLAGADQVSYFAVNFGGPGWSGDTSLPGPPDNWCFILWTMDGMANDTSDPTYPLNLVGLNAANAITNCGQESSPGAGDMVELCGGFFYGDPISDFTPLEWSFHFGGPIDAELADIPSYFTPYGYTTDNFWGSWLGSQLLYGGGVNSLTYAWAVDGSLATVVNGSEPVRLTATGWVGPNGPESGMYIHFIPWLFTFQ